ncbi:PLP-dependent cysteine synthase family protein [Candidatus Poriferisodalis sp.]|uniref:PLP-dependent cysteine synthase family protein n=1 Tax=Candidatus Poriferisodalis sp. TaxID=3101277 RepID=UPI003B5B5B9F
MAADGPMASGVPDPLDGLDIAPSILELVGRTPMVRFSRVAPHIMTPVVAKLETTNPGGSVKDRAAIAMIDAAEADGQLRPGDVIVEPTSGNTGVGLAVVAAQRGYRCVFVCTDKVAPEKVALLRAYGAEVVVCPVALAPEDPRSYYSTAARLRSETPRAFSPDQYSNQNNPRAHYETTGPEIWDQTGGRVTHFVAGAGTGGTVSGVGRYLKEQNPAIEVVVADPPESVYAGGDGSSYLVEGIGEDFWPTTYDASIVDRVIPVTDAESFAMARHVTRTEGLLIGGSGGTAITGAVRVAAELDAAGRAADSLVVTLIPDSGRGYLSRVFDDEWLAERGLPVDGALPASGGDCKEPG